MAFPLQLITPPTQEPLAVSDMHTQLRLDPGFTDDDAAIADMISAAREEVEAITGRALWPQTWKLAADWFPVYRWWDYAPSRSDYDSLGNYNFMGWRWNQSQTISVPRPPLIGVQSLTYVSPIDGSTQSIDPTTIQIDTLSEPGRILPAYGQYWPQVQPQADAVQLTFRAGYGQQLTGVALNANGQATLQIGDPALFASLDSLVRVDGQGLGAYTVTNTGLITLAAADQSAELTAAYTLAAVPAWARQALRLIVAAWYENRSEFITGQPGGATIPWGAAAILMKHRTEIFGYVARG